MNIELFGTNTKMTVGNYFLNQDVATIGPDVITRTLPPKTDLHFTAAASSTTAEVAVAATIIVYNSIEVNRAV
jgi:hypothetical protein